MMRIRLGLIVFLVFNLLQFTVEAVAQDNHERYRVVIMTDMTHDDGNSLIRYLYYSPHFDTEAIIVTNQLPDYNHNDDGPWMKIQSILKAYAQEYDQLIKHDPRFPPYEELSAITKRGRGALPIIWTTEDREFAGQIADRYVESSWGKIRFEDWIGEGENPNGEPKDSEGSEQLIEVFNKDDDRPIFVQLWGGPITFIQALYRFEERYGSKELDQLLDKLFVYSIHMQDISIDYLIDLEKVRERECLNMGETQSTYHGKRVKPGIFMVDEGHFWRYLNAVERSQVNGHGPLSELYDGGGEGDTPSFLYLISALKGLNDPFDPTQGSWGSMFTSMGNSFPDNYYQTCGVKNNELERWIEDATNSFMARLQWSVKDTESVNYAPVAVLNGDTGNSVIQRSVKPGEQIRLDASDSYDLSGDEIHFNWFQYEEADSYRGSVQITDKSSPMTVMEVPGDAAGFDIHLILEVRDDGEPELISYRRLILQVGAG